MQVQRTRAAKIKVSGFVQGVGYRFYVLDTARVYGVNGYVKNLSAGDVEIFASAEESVLHGFIEKLKEGPLYSRVDDVSVEFAEDEGCYTDFAIIH